MINYNNNTYLAGSCCEILVPCLDYCLDDICANKFMHNLMVDNNLQVFRVQEATQVWMYVLGDTQMHAFEHFQTCSSTTHYYYY